MGWPSPPETSASPIAPDPDALERALGSSIRGRLIGGQAFDKAIPWASGWTRVPLRRVGKGITDISRRFLVLFLLISEGELSAAENLTFGDVAAEELGLIRGVTYNVYLGTPNQPVDPLLLGVEPRWTSNMPGTAFVIVRLDGQNPRHGTVDYDDAKITIGPRMVYDFRTDATLTTRYPRSSPPLLLADAYIDPTFGAGWPKTGPDWAESFADAANVCDFVIATRGAVPPTAPTVAAHPSGGLPVSPVTWVYTAVIDGVETGPSPPSAPYIPPGFLLGASLTAPAVASADAYRWYRNKRGQSQRYLVGETATPAFIDLRADFELMNNSPPGSSEPIKRYEITGWVGEQMAWDDAVEMFRAHMAASVAYNGETLKIWIDAAQVPSGIHFTEDDIEGDIELEGTGMSRLWGRAIADFVNRDMNYKNDEVRIDHPNLSLPPSEAEREERREVRLRLPLSPTFDQTSRLLGQHYERSRHAVFGAMVVRDKGSRALPGLVVNVTHSTGPLSNTPVIVTDVNPVDDGKKYHIRFEFYDATVYDDTLQHNPAPLLPTGSSPNEVAPLVTGLRVREIVTTGPAGTPWPHLEISFDKPTWRWARAVRVKVRDDQTVATYEVTEGPVQHPAPRYGQRHIITAQIIGPPPGFVAGPETIDEITPFFEPYYVPTPNAPGFVSAGMLYWNEPPGYREVPHTGGWSAGAGWETFSLARLDDRWAGDASIAMAFLDDTLSQTITKDLGTDGARKLAGVAIDWSLLGGGTESSFDVEYSDDGAAWTAVPFPIENISFPHDMTKAGRREQRFGFIAGPHRYWRINFAQDPANNGATWGITEIVWFEEWGLSSGRNPFIHHYELWDEVTGHLVTTIPADSRPSATSPLDVNQTARHSGVTNYFDLTIFSVSLLGRKSAGSHIYSAAAPGVAFRPSIDMQEYATTPTKQGGSAGVTGMLAAGQHQLTPLTLSSLVNGDNNDVALTANKGIVRITPGPTAAYAITGLAGGIDGLVVTLVNQVNQTLTLKNENAGSAAANRIAMPGSANKDFTFRQAITLWYDGTSALWRPLSAVSL